VPQPVAEGVEALCVVSRTDPLAMIDVGDVAEFVHHAPFFGPGHLAGQRRFQLAEVAAEYRLLVVGKALVVEHQDGVTIHADLDRCDLVGRQRVGKVDAGDLADEAGVHGPLTLLVKRKSAIGWFLADPALRVASCSPRSRALRAACGGGLRQSLTAAVRAARASAGRDEETASQPNQETSMVL